jgi:hypothetical protein
VICEYLVRGIEFKQGVTRCYYRADGVVWFRPLLEKFPWDIGLHDMGDTRGVKVFFSTPITGMQDVFMPVKTFSESYDLESGETLGFSVKYVFYYSETFFDDERC